MSTRTRKKKIKRTLKQRAEEIFRLINNNSEPIAKSRFKDIGLSSTAADNWLDLIIYIQNQNRIHLFKAGSYTFVDKQVFIDRVSSSKYLQLCWNNFLNSEVSHEKRLGYLNDFAKAYLFLERAKLDEGEQ
ncbi:MAG: hypothetical protein ACW964_03775 [Candidatus Hodarchaeales archaeon]|jgi:hypothetical protein